MIPVYNIEDLTIEMVDKLIDKGVVFDVRSQASVLPKTAEDCEADRFWSDRGGGGLCVRATSEER